MNRIMTMEALDEGVLIDYLQIKCPSYEIQKSEFGSSTIRDIQGYAIPMGAKGLVRNVACQNSA